MRNRRLGGGRSGRRVSDHRSKAIFGFWPRYAHGILAARGLIASLAICSRSPTSDQSCSGCSCNGCRLKIVSSLYCAEKRGDHPPLTDVIVRRDFAGQSSFKRLLRTKVCCSRSVPIRKAGGVFRSQRVGGEIAVAAAHFRKESDDAQSCRSSD
jgi:hypothetical protein